MDTENIEVIRIIPYLSLQLYICSSLNWRRLPEYEAKRWLLASEQIKESPPVRKLENTSFIWTRFSEPVECKCRYKSAVVC